MKNASNVSKAYLHHKLLHSWWFYSTNILVRQKDEMQIHRPLWQLYCFSLFLLVINSQEPISFLFFFWFSFFSLNKTASQTGVFYCCKAILDWSFGKYCPFIGQGVANEVVVHVHEGLIKESLKPRVCSNSLDWLKMVYSFFVWLLLPVTNEFLLL